MTTHRVFRRNKLGWNGIARKADLHFTSTYLNFTSLYDTRVARPPQCPIRRTLSSPPPDRPQEATVWWSVAPLTAGCPIHTRVLCEDEWDVCGWENRYTSSMDSVRFGRALGFGARHAAKAIAGAVDAATAPNPTPVRKPAPQPTPPASSTGPANDPIAQAARTAAHVTVQAQVRARETSQNVARGSKRFGDSVWTPLKKLSGVLWLEITGSFFGLFAVFAGQAAWTHRADLHSTALNHDDHLHFLAFVAMAAVFGYFCISSFVRAYRK